MTREQVKELLPIITAFANGKTIQETLSNGFVWTDVQSPSFAGPPQCYRIKPEPRELWLAVPKGQSFTIAFVWDRKPEATKVIDYDIIHVHEVTD